METPESEPASKAQRFFVGIVGKGENADRRSAARESWISRLPKGMEAGFLLPRSQTVQEENDILIYDSGEQGEGSVASLKALIAVSLGASEADWFYFCHDQVFVDPERLARLLSRGGDLIAESSGRGSLSGCSAGLAVSRGLAIFLTDPVRTLSPEDEWGFLSETARAFGTEAIFTDLLSSSPWRSPLPGNEIVAVHCPCAKTYRAIHAALTDRVEMEFLVNHRGWKDVLRFLESGFFYRVLTPDFGSWRSEQGNLTLHWYSWPPESVSMKPDGSASGDTMEFTAIRRKMERHSSDRQREVSCCSVALAYPRQETSFIAEWVDYHLTMGVDKVFLGIHVNPEFSPDEQIMTAKRPFPPMYVLDSSEGDVLADFFAELAPFRDRVACWLFPRIERRVHGECATQDMLYRRLLDGHRHEFEWVAVHDIDEFLVPQNHTSLTDALSMVPDSISTIQLRQVICESRWNADMSPRREPILSLPMRIGEPLQHGHGPKAISRLSRTFKIGIHRGDVAGKTLFDDSIFHYHYRGFPSQTEVTGYRLPVPVEEFDMRDDRPRTLFEHAKERERVNLALSGG